jgi:hypothetical protein
VQSDAQLTQSTGGGPPRELEERLRGFSRQKHAAALEAGLRAEPGVLGEASAARVAANFAVELVESEVLRDEETTAAAGTAGETVPA